MSFILLQIPCYNEEHHLPVTVAGLPRTFTDNKQRVWPIRWMVVDDGSEDRTVATARSLGVDYVLTLPHQGLAQTWVAGIQESFRLGAEYLVNLDADNQYAIEDLPKLLHQLVDARADLVIGCRVFDNIPHFSYIKRRLQELGSFVVSTLSGLDIPDVTSGYRGLNRRAMASLCVHSRYTYTLETIIQAGSLGFKVSCVSVGTNEKLRESRLMRSTSSYVWRSLDAMFRITVLYRAFQTFMGLAILFLLPSLFLIGRFFYYDATSGRSGHTQSLVIAAIGIILFLGNAVVAVVTDLIAANRRLLEGIRARQLLSEAERKMPSGAPLDQPPTKL